MEHEECAICGRDSQELRHNLGKSQGHRFRGLRASHTELLEAVQEMVGYFDYYGPYSFADDGNALLGLRKAIIHATEATHA